MPLLAAAAAGRRRDAVAGTNLDTGLGVGRGLGTHALLDLAGHGQESLLDVRGVLGRGLKEGDSQAVGELLHKLVRNIRRIELHTTFCRTLATVYSTTFLSDISLLLPTRSLLTPSVA